MHFFANYSGGMRSPFDERSVQAFAANICSNVRLTDVVPAPEEPVTEMIGCFADISCQFLTNSGSEKAATAEKRGALARSVRLVVQAHDVIDFSFWSRPR